MLVPVTQEINKQQHREKSKSGHEHWIFFAECNPSTRDPKMHNGPQLWFGGFRFLGMPPGSEFGVLCWPVFACGINMLRSNCT